MADTFTLSVLVLVLSLGALGALGSFGSHKSVVDTVLLSALIAVASVACWSLPPAQNHHVASVATEARSVALSLNSSSSYLGFSAGGAIGGAVVGGLSIHALSWVSAGIEVVALAVVLVGAGRVGATRKHPGPGQSPLTDRSASVPQDVSAHSSK